MEGWFGILVSGIVSLITGVGGTVLFFRPKLKEANANAQKAQTDAQEYAYNSLLERMNKMEQSHNEQLNNQSAEIAQLRDEVLQLNREKFENDKRIIQLESENSTLRERVDGLEKELQAYRTIAGK